MLFLSLFILSFVPLISSSFLFSFFISSIFKFNIISLSCSLFAELLFDFLFSLSLISLDLLLLFSDIFFSSFIAWVISLLSINSNLYWVKCKEFINSLFSLISNNELLILLILSFFSSFDLFNLFNFPSSSLIFKFISISFSSFLAISSIPFSFFLKKILFIIKSLGFILIPLLSNFSNLSIILIVSWIKLNLPFNCFPFLIKLKTFLF